MSDSKVLDLWTQAKVLVDSLEKDMEKHTVKNNVSAGVRVRKGLRLLKQQLSELVRESLVKDEGVRAERKVKRASTPKA